MISLTQRSNNGAAGLGEAGQGAARPGLAWQGSARQGNYLIVETF
jgi:hypothetical protein